VGRVGISIFRRVGFLDLKTEGGVVYGKDEIEV